MVCTNKFPTKGFVESDATHAQRTQEEPYASSPSQNLPPSGKLSAKSVKTVLSINRKEPSYTLEVQTSLARKHKVYTRSMTY